MLPTSLFWATYEQQGNTIALWAAELHRPPSCSAWLIPVTWFQAFNPFMIFAFTPFIVALWRWQGAARALHRHEDGDRLLSERRLVADHARRGAGDRRRAGHGQASWLWLFAYFVVITVGELYLSPTGLRWSPRWRRCACCR